MHLIHDCVGELRPVRSRGDNVILVVSGAYATGAIMMVLWSIDVAILGAATVATRPSHIVWFAIKDYGVGHGVTITMCTPVRGRRLRQPSMRWHMPGPTSNPIMSTRCARPRGLLLSMNYVVSSCHGRTVRLCLVESHVGAIRPRQVAILTAWTWSS